MESGNRPRRVRALRLRKRVQVSWNAGGHSPSMGFTANVSATGFSLASTHVQPPGTAIVALLQLPGGPSQVRGVVAWARRAPRAIAGQPSMMGVRLLGADQGFLQYVRELQPGDAGVTRSEG